MLAGYGAAAGSKGTEAAAPAAALPAPAAAASGTPAAAAPVCAHVGLQHPESVTHTCGHSHEPNGRIRSRQQPGAMPTAPAVRGAATAGGGGGSSVQAVRRREELESSVLKQDKAIQTVVVIAQALVVATQWAKAQGGFLVRIQPALVLLSLAMALVIMLAVPRFYMRNRSWLSPILRWSACIPPSTRRVGVGTALIMERPSQPGIKGLLLDFLRVSTGNRILPLTFHSVFLVLPPTSALLTQAALTAFTWNSSGYCSTQLLSSPLSRARQLRAATALEYVALPLAAVQPVAGVLLPSTVLLAGSAPEEAVCRAIASMMHLCLGLLLPLAVSVYCWRPHQQQARDRAAVAANGWRERLRQVVLTSDRWLHFMLGGEACTAVRVVVFWYIVANCWLVITRVVVGL